uniref:ABC transporter domain-containing protein n=1 Tax=Panagrolaimus sp. PS1159 TaxID=55785 RepID=A0AC35G7Z4_9BILA
MNKEDYHDLDALIPTGHTTPDDDPFGPNSIIAPKFGITVEDDYEKAPSNVTVMPSMKLTWHSICARPFTEVQEKTSILASALEAIGVYNPADPIKKHAPRKLILNHCFGAAYPGEVLALMGASGAGKTTLMNILTQRNLDTVSTTGTIKINDAEVGQSTLRKLSAYAQQDDLFISTMTVKEHLTFTALMKMGKHYSSRQREKRVQSVMEDLALTKCQNTLIGNPQHGIKGISGGEKKRLSFASEIMTSPPLLFCDEPTSGLDSFMAKQTIQVLKQLASRKNMTIVCTIHQPSSFIFSLFDRVCFMGEGRTAFLGTIAEAREFWKSLKDPVPEKSNPADHFISSLAIKAGEEAESDEKATHICNSFIKSSLGQELNQTALGEESSSPSSSSTALSMESIWEGNAKLKGKTFQRYKATWFQQFFGLLKRSFLGNLRNPVVLHVRIFQTFVIAIILAMIYFGTKISQSTIMNVNGNLFNVVMNMNFMFQFTAVNMFCEELPIFLRENQANMYRVTPYFLSKNISEGIQYIIYPTIFAAIVYWFSGLVQSLDAFLIFTLVCILVTNVGISISYMMSCIFGTVAIAINVMPVLVIPLMAFGGFFININTIPIYFLPLRYISYFAYGYEALAVNEWSRIDKIGGCNELSSKNSTFCLSTGHEVIESIGFKESNLWPNIIILFSMILIFRTIAFIALWIRVETKK